MKKSSAGKRSRKHRYRPSSTEATNFSDLPEEILCHITQHLYLPELEALSTVCRRLRATCTEILHKEQEVARNNIRDLRLDSTEYGYHDFLLQILKHEINPNYVKRLDCHSACKQPPFNAQDEEIDIAQYIGWTPRDIQIVRAAVIYSSWLRDIVSPDELIAKMLNGEEDAVLALMVPMLKNLSFFVPPARASVLLEVFVKIARLQIVAEIENPELWQRLPLRKLHTIYATATWTSDITLVETIHYVSLPCVRRVYLDGGAITQIPVHERANLRSIGEKKIPKSRACTILIRHGEMWRDIAELLVNHFAGPCVIRQHMDEHIPSEVEAQEDWVGYRLMENGIIPKDPMFYYWDHCTISGEKDPVTKQIKENSRSVEFGIKYRNFHYDSDFLAFDIAQYEEDMRQVGMVASPEWLSVVKWNHGLTDPMLDAASLDLI